MIMSIKEIDEASPIRGSVYIRHKSVEHISNKSKTTSMRERPVCKCTYTSGYDRVLAKARTQSFYFENVLQSAGVRI